MDRLPLRVYADTSVFGGVFDAEFRDSSRAFFDQVEDGRFALVSSGLVRDELVGAPEEVRDFARLALATAEGVEITAEALRLGQAYVQAGIVTPKFGNDALHVALATLASCDLVVSWNFKHHVHFLKTRRYNAVNALHDYDPIEICSPPEVLRYEEEL